MPLSLPQKMTKRGMDIAGASIGLVLTGWIIVLAYILVRLDSGGSGFYVQTRIGQFGKPFRLVKIRTMNNIKGFDSTVTTQSDPRITRLGHFLRKTKIDELPQLWNVLIGDMSLVGPRPDVPGYADELKGEDRVILCVRPGITGPASLRYRDEEAILAGVEDPEAYNRNVIWSDKVRINRDYIKNYSLWTDIRLLWITIAG